MSIHMCVCSMCERAVHTRVHVCMRARDNLRCYPQGPPTSLEARSVIDWELTS